MNNFARIATMCICMALLALPTIGYNQERKASEDVYQFSLHYDQYAIFYIISLGDGLSQTARLTVFEVTGVDEIAIRKLHQVDLANRCTPLEHILCGAGRFFLTFDEGYLFRDVRKTKNMLGVYDLLRKERTVYAFDDLFTEEVLKRQGLSSAEYVSAQKWRQDLGKVEQHFDTNHLVFRVPLPKPERKSDPPMFQEIVIDLPTRAAQVELASKFVDIDATRIQDPKLEYPNNYIEASQGAEQSSRMPQYLRLVNFRGHDALVFEYDSESGEYRKVALEKWPVTQGKLRIRCGTHDD